jgi:putative transcriptional regulator
LWPIKTKSTRLSIKTRIRSPESNKLFLSLPVWGMGTKSDVTRQTIIALEEGRYNPSLVLAYNVTVLFQKNHIEEVFILEEE